MQACAAMRVTDSRVEDAFATVRREDFLGPGPWPIMRFSGEYAPTPAADPVYLYANNLVGISPERHINNGEPSLHALLLARAAPQPGDHVVHVGAGTGYYSALMAHLAGPTGRVTAIEFEPDLAARARENFARAANVTIVEGDGTIAPFDPADVIYVNAGATRPADTWLDRLKDGGRLILPLTTDKGFGSLARGVEAMRRSGAVFLVTRQGNDFAARWISPVAIYPCQGLRDPEAERALSAAFEKENPRRVTRLYRRNIVAEEHCWVQTPGWCLAYE
jgi:protein-L-isoaspartate(D-aspartate) O-methyltransferase